MENLIDLKALDPAVAAVIGTHQRKRELQKLPAKERMAKIRKQANYEKRKVRKIGLDLDPEVINDIKGMAEKNGTSASQIVNLVLHLFLRAYGRGEVDLAKYRVIIESNPKYDYKMDWRKGGEE